MDFNTFLIRFGLDPNNFVNAFVDPIITPTGFIYELVQKADIRICPHCNSNKAYVNDYDIIEIGCSYNDHIEEKLRIKRVRFKCSKCHRTFTPDLVGITPHCQITEVQRKLITADFTRKLTFAQIADKYHLSSSRIIQLFDTLVPYVPRLKMPRVLCVDEIKFSSELDQKYICVLSNFESGELVDITRNRQLPYLRDYFTSIPLKERENTLVFISDMYEAYDTICRSFFPKAIHVIDLFHVLTQLTNAVNRIRTRVMNSYAEKGSPIYNFMKAHWECFLCRLNKIPDKFYTYKKTGEMFHYDDMVFKCIKTNETLWTGYNTLQELFKYSSCSDYEDALNFIHRIVTKLQNSQDQILISVAKTYHAWRYEIANGLAKSQRVFKYTNAIAEVNNSHLKTILKAAYGYRSFDRFRKRALLISTWTSTKRKES